jgi:hypothetical protein
MPKRASRSTKSKAKAPAGAAANALAARQAAVAGTRAAGKAISTGIARAKVPLVAGGAAAAGFAGGLALIRRQGSKR